MINFLGIVLFILSGQVVLEQKVYKTEAECHAGVGKRVEELNKDPRLNLGLIAVCVAKPIQDGPQQSRK